MNPCARSARENFFGHEPVFDIFFQKFINELLDRKKNYALRRRILVQKFRVFPPVYIKLEVKNEEISRNHEIPKKVEFF